MMTNRRIRPWRRLAEALQALLIIGIPFVRIRGESALRFDIPSLRLHVFGTGLWMDEFFIVLIAIIFFTFLIIFVTILFGRIWCGWLCPQTVLIDLTWFLDKAKSKGAVQITAAYLATLLVSGLVAANLVWYFVSPYDFFPDLMRWTLGAVTWGFWISLTAIIFLNYAFLRHTWCATVCPYAKLQGALFDDRTMVIAFDRRREDECMDCRACVKVCPVKIDIRSGLSAACINCAECMDTCAERMEKRQKKSLIGYSFGSPGAEGKLLRQNIAPIGSLTLLSFAFLLYLSLSRSPIDLTVLPNYEFRPRLTSQREAVNSYTVAIKNRGDQDLELHLGAHLQDMPLRVVPEKISLGAGEYKKTVVFVVYPDAEEGGLSRVVELTLGTGTHSGVSISRKFTFIVPGAS